MGKKGEGLTLLQHEMRVQSEPRGKGSLVSGQLLNHEV